MTTLLPMRAANRRIISSRRRRAIAKGYRSGLEETVSRQIEDAGLVVCYEQDKIEYVWPERSSTYCPDFRLPKQDGCFFVETKGRFTVEDRNKHLLIREQHGDAYDIRFVFSNQNAKLYKGSPTTYAQWCEKHGFQYSNRTIPEEWLSEGEKES